MRRLYTIENVEDLRKKINRDYLIRLTTRPSSKGNRVVC